MPPKRSQPTSSDQDSAAEITALREAVRDLTGQVRTLTNAIDDLREEIDWTLRNPAAAQLTPEPYRVTSLPLDPVAVDFHDRVNAVSPAQLDTLRNPQTDMPVLVPLPPPPRGQLF